MNNLAIENFTKKNDYLICIDSDGTAIDAMTVKHRKCHGPSFIEEWNLYQNEDEVQKIWDDINLFNSTRGVNRYIALVEILEKINGTYVEVDKLEISTLKQWVETTYDLSNKGIKAEIENGNDSPILKKALSWSLKINEKIAKLSASDKVAFEGVSKCLDYAKGKVDIAVVSSSNMDAIYSEWEHYDLLKYLDVMTSQEVGTKGECIASMLKKGYDKNKVLMIGDAYPDLDAAKENDVYFYPILTTHEKESWQELEGKYLDELIAGNFEEHKETVIKKFKNNFGK